MTANMHWIARVDALLDEAIAAEITPAAVIAIAVDGEAVYRRAVGSLQVVDDAGRPIPPADRTPVDFDSQFDLASVTKVYSAHTLLALTEEGALSLDDSLGDLLPEYRAGNRARVSLRHLLTHTSGLPATWDGWRAPLARAITGLEADAPPFTATPLTDRAALIDDLLRTPLTAAPGTRWEYACTGFNTAMALAERATGEDWETLVHRTTLCPLGLGATGFRPGQQQTAATEYQPEFHRGTVRGVVHDESSWSLGGASANAGLFATADDVLAFAEVIRLGNTPRTRHEMWDDQLPAQLGRDDSPHGGHSHGASLGLRIGDRPWMGADGSQSRGHTGFTGTSMQLDRGRRTSIVLLSNGVHPTRESTGVHALRAAIATAVQEGVPPCR